MIYPEVHFPMEANLRLERRGVHQSETPSSLDMAHHISVVSYHRCGEALVTMLPLRLTTRTFKRMKLTPQVGGSPPNAPSRQDLMLQGRGTHHNSIGGSRDRKSTRLNSSHITRSRMPSSA